MSDWVVIGGTIRGAVHLLQGKPCQDALLVQNNEAYHYSLACLADGHGSENCPYSDEGAQAAVETAETLFASIFSQNTPVEAFATLDANKEIWLPKQMEAQWKARIRDIHAQKERPSEEPFPYHLYGTTLLALVAMQDFIFAMQIGDGDILTVDRDASVRWLIPPDYTSDNETYSLCMDSCWSYIKTHILPLNDERDSPLMFLLSTDGYANSFFEPLGFIKAGADIYKLWRDNGIDYIKEHLEDWLSHSSADGSGDDITMALVFRG